MSDLEQGVIVVPFTDKEILTKAIEKAKANGWETNIISVNVGYENTFIFNHDFAKALWGTNRNLSLRGASEKYDGDDDWQYHLQMMVIAKDPIKYLEDNIVWAD